MPVHSSPIIYKAKCVGQDINPTVYCL